MSNNTTPAAALESLYTAFAGHDRDDVQQVASGVVASAIYLAYQAGRSEITLADLVAGAADYQADEDFGMRACKSFHDDIPALAAKVEGHLASLVVS